MRSAVRLDVLADDAAVTGGRSLRSGVATRSCITSTSIEIVGYGACAGAAGCGRPGRPASGAARLRTSRFTTKRTLAWAASDARTLRSCAGAVTPARTRGGICGPGPRDGGGDDANATSRSRSSGRVRRRACALAGPRPRAQRAVGARVLASDLPQGGPSNSRYCPTGETG